MLIDVNIHERTHWGFFVDFDAVTKSRLFCRHTRIVLGTRFKSQSKMAARSLNNAMPKEISKEIDEFYGKLEMKYYSGIQREDVPQKLAVQDLFKNNVPVPIMIHFKVVKSLCKQAVI